VDLIAEINQAIAELDGDGTLTKPLSHLLHRVRAQLAEAAASPPAGEPWGDAHLRRIRGAYDQLAPSAAPPEAAPPPTPEKP
jgi:hypothetical protein